MDNWKIPLRLISDAQDFLPDFIEAPKWYSIYGIYPKYTNLITAMQKAKEWMTTQEKVSRQACSKPTFLPFT